MIPRPPVCKSPFHSGDSACAGGRIAPVAQDGESKPLPRRAADATVGAKLTFPPNLYTHLANPIPA